MTLKTYIAKSVVSLTVPLNDNLWAWINFLPLVDGTSKFLTTKEELQTALEAHPKFGKLFMLDGSESVTGDITMPQVTYYTKDDLQAQIDDLNRRIDELTPGGEIGPNTVGSREIKDDSVEMEDLSRNVKDKMLTDNDRVTQEDINSFDV